MDKRNARREPRKTLSWAERQERHAAKMAKKTPDEVESYAMNYSLWHLSRRMLPEAELRRKLVAKLVPEDVCDRVIARLRENGAVDDAEFAASYARSATRSRSLSLSRVKQDLIRKGIPAETVETVIAESFESQEDDGEWDRALLIAGKKVRATVRETDPRRRRQKVINAVVSKGFHYSIAARAADEALNT